MWTAHDLILFTPRYLQQKDWKCINMHQNTMVQRCEHLMTTKSTKPKSAGSWAKVYADEHPGPAGEDLHELLQWWKRQSCSPSTRFLDMFVARKLVEAASTSTDFLMAHPYDFCWKFKSDLSSFLSLVQFHGNFWGFVSAKKIAEALLRFSSDLDGGRPSDPDAGRRFDRFRNPKSWSAAHVWAWEDFCRKLWLWEPGIRDVDVEIVSQWYLNIGVLVLRCSESWTTRSKWKTDPKSMCPTSSWSTKWYKMTMSKSKWT